MKYKLGIFLGAVLLISILALSLFAHHGASAYDRDKLTNFKATITGFRWSNPHVQIFFDATDNGGNVIHWNCETINPGMLAKQGWSKSTLKAGDQVTIAAFPAREGAPVCLLQKLTLADGKTLQAVLLD